MSTSRSRRSPSSSRGDHEAQAPRADIAAPAHAGGDSPRVTRRNHRSKTTKEFPESVRYDLETALIGLCDVWFEEIKPHLIRNNIKLHLNTRGGEGGDFEAANSSHEPPCAHLDPGAAFDQRALRNVASADCYPKRRAASRAPCPRLQEPLRPVTSPWHHRPPNLNINSDGRKSRSTQGAAPRVLRSMPFQYPSSPRRLSPSPPLRPAMPISPSQIQAQINHLNKHMAPKQIHSDGRKSRSTQGAAPRVLRSMPFQYPSSPRRLSPSPPAMPLSPYQMQAQLDHLDKQMAPKQSQRAFGSPKRKQDREKSLYPPLPLQFPWRVPCQGQCQYAYEASPRPSCSRAPSVSSLRQPVNKPFPNPD